MDQWQILAVLGILICAQNLVFGLSPDEHLSPELSDALQLLRKDEVVRFSIECLREGGEICRAEQVQSYAWKFPRVDPAARTRFYHTYVCAWTEDSTKCPVDGGWSSWGAWGDCDTTCGGGAKARSRECNWPRPQNGGLPCHGQDTSVTSCRVAMACPKTEEEGEVSLQRRALKCLAPFNKENAELRTLCMGGSCSYQQVLEMVTPRNLSDIYWNNLMCYKYSRGCAVDGGWAEWNAWSSCSSQCGMGKAYRFRRCTNPQPIHGGQLCEGPEFEEGPCYDDSCEHAVGIFVTPWSMWSECSTTCNEGIRTSTRRCHGAKECQMGNGSMVADQSREIPCTNALCPVKGGWSEWSEWTVCTSLCGRGRRMKERTCNNPRPLGEGNDCVGDTNAMGDCSHDAPFCQEIPKDAVPMYEDWSPWSDCSSKCEGGVRIRHRTCAEEGKTCRGEVYNIETCNEDLPCIVDGGWTEWSAWSVCTVTCGEGETERYRQCIQPRPEFGGRSCEGDANEKKKCTVSECPVTASTWGSWAEWSECTVTCNGGTSTRQRQCHRKSNSRKWLRKECVGEDRQVRVCSIKPCPVNGNWAGWNDWAECSAACGEGGLTRHRTCTDPAPEGDGELCGGYGTDTVLCYRQPCPDPDLIVRTCDGSSFMMYRQASVSTKHFLLYMRFKPAKRSGLLALRHNDPVSDQVVSVGFANGQVRLYAKHGKTEGEVFSIGQVQLNKWNSIEAKITGGRCSLRLNDGLPTFRDFTQPLPRYVNWDQPMYVGGALPNLFPGPAEEYVGYVGAISEIRVNYKEYTLHDVRPEWTGTGLPFVNFNVGTEPADIDAQLPVFTGYEFTSLPCPSTDELAFRVTFRSDAPDGIILYCVGQTAGSFIALTVFDSRLVMFVNYGSGTKFAKSEEIGLSKWMTTQLSLRGRDVEMRINGGPAIQLTASGTENFIPSPSVSVGGVPRPTKMVAHLTTGSEKGLIGAMYEMTINEKQYLLSETAMQTHDTYIDTASSTMSAHYREIRGLLLKTVVLHCNYSNIQNLNPAVIWLKDDRILENSDYVTILKKNAVFLHTSYLSVHLLNKNTEGLYTCMLQLGGKSIITHAFGVSVYEPHGVEFEVEPSVEALVIGIVMLVVGIVVGIILLSCIRALRKKVYFLDKTYQCTVFYLGLDAMGCVKEPDIPDPVLVRKANLSYDGDFLAREEKIKFDQALKKEQLNKQRGKTSKKRAKDTSTKTTGDGNVGKEESLRRKSEATSTIEDDFDTSFSSLVFEGNSEEENEPIHANVEARKRLSSAKDTSTSTKTSNDGNVGKEAGTSVKENRHDGRKSEATSTDEVDFDTSFSSLIFEGNSEKGNSEEGNSEEGNSGEGNEPIYVNIEAIRAHKQQMEQQKSDPGEPVEVNMEPKYGSMHGKKDATDPSWSAIPEETLQELDQIYASVPRSDEEKRRESVDLASHDAGHLFSHRGSIGGAVTKLTEAVVDLEEGQEENTSL